MKRIVKRIMIVAATTILALVMATLFFVRQPKFGRLPQGERLERVKKSPHYKNGSFQNLSPTPDLTERVSYYQVMKEFFFTKRPRRIPKDTIPSIKTDLLHLSPDQNILVWFGHSSYFMQVDGKTILVDPVFCGAASPVRFTTRSFVGTDAYTTDDLPPIDYLFISHDHWDHVDHETLLKLKSKVGKVLCGLGTGEHFEYWGYSADQIVERDWNEEIKLDSGFSAVTIPARHFSGRGFSRNKALWTSYILQTPSLKIFIGGDSGYDAHFAEAGKKYGPVDVAILENGQYDKSWKYIHMMPEEVLKAAQDLGAKKLFPVHSSKFALGNHAWDEPLKRITALGTKAGMPLITPIIGEQVSLGDSAKTFTPWWDKLD